MESKKLLLVIILSMLLVFEKGASTTVTYDHKALVIDGKRRILQSGSIHYPRTTPEVSVFFLCMAMWGFLFSS